MNRKSIWANSKGTSGGKSDFVVKLIERRRRMYLALLACRYILDKEKS